MAAPELTESGTGSRAPAFRRRQSLARLRPARAMRDEGRPARADPLRSAGGLGRRLRHHLITLVGRPDRHRGMSQLGERRDDTERITRAGAAEARGRSRQRDRGRRSRSAASDLASYSRRIGLERLRRARRSHHSTSASCTSTGSTREPLRWPVVREGRAGRASARRSGRRLGRADRVGEPVRHAGRRATSSRRRTRAPSVPPSASRRRARSRIRSGSAHRAGRRSEAWTCERVVEACGIPVAAERLEHERLDPELA